MLSLFPPMTHLPPAVVRTLRASLAKSTIKQYDGIVLRFGKFLLQQEKGVLDVDTALILDFLSNFANNGFAFSTVRSMKTAIVKAVRLRRDDFTLNESMMAQFMAGAKNECRLFSRKAVIWDAQAVVDDIARRPMPTCLSRLAQETVTILALATGARADDLSKMGAAVYPQGRGTFIPFLEHQKTSRRTKEPRTGVTVAPFPTDRVCPVFLVNRYLEQTRELPNRANFLFVRSDTGARVQLPTLRGWLVKTLQRAGIVAPPGSTRSAAASFASAQKLSFDQIARMTGWQRESTFAVHYRRKIVHNSGNLMLR